MEMSSAIQYTSNNRYLGLLAVAWMDMEFVENSASVQLFAMAEANMWYVSPSFNTCVIS